MSNFEKAIEKLHEESRQENNNVKVSVMALNAIYNSLTDNQKHELDDAFMIVLHN